MRIIPTRTIISLCTMISALIGGACSIQQAGGVLAGIFTLGLAGAIKGHEIKDVYYVGVVDPLGQLPPTLYRISLRGEASLVSSVRFESGWVKADLVDSLGANIRLEDAGVRITEGDGNELQLESGRPLWLFGPEGFRPAPKDERLVVVMGSDPSEFFSAVAKVLGEINTASQLQSAGLAGQQTEILSMLVDANDELRVIEQNKQETN